MLCRKCSAMIPNGSVFCCMCGVKQEKPAHAAKKRGNGQGTVFKIGDKWACEITLGYAKDGDKLRRRARRKSGFKTKRDALAYLETLRSTPEKTTAITVSQLWEMFQKTAELSDSKMTAYRIAYNKIKNEIDYRTIDSFSVSELQDLTDESAPSYYTRRDIKSLLSHFYKIAIRDDYTDKNRAQYIKLPKLVSSERETFGENDIKALWRDFKQPSKITAGILTMLYTGIRAGELLTIKSENVHLDEQYMTGGIKTERGKARKIILPDKLLPVIRFLLAQDDGRLCGYAYKNAFYDDWIAKRTDLKLREALTPYCCRHTYITRLTALKVSPAMLQELVGHEDYETTLDYTHLSVEDRLKEVNRLD